MSGGTADDWVVEAAQILVAFAQVREDPLIDLAVLDRLGGRELNVMMIASGGCTAALLAAGGRVTRLQLVDANVAQCAIARLKLRLLENHAPDARVRLLGHEPMDLAERGTILAEAAGTIIKDGFDDGPWERFVGLGPDHVGRYEYLFAELRRHMAEFRRELESLLALRDTTEQSCRAAPGTALGRAMDAAFDDVMSLANLVWVFGEAATQNARQPFARHFAGRTRIALATFPAADNPWLWQMLLGRFPPDARYPWLDAATPVVMPRVAYVVEPMDRALAKAAAGSFDYVHLSNILDWLGEAEARRTLELTAGALRPGGVTLIRQLNSTLDIPALGPQFDWDAAAAAELHARDRSFFYHALHLGVRR